MANVIISNSGSLVINGGSSSMPKGGYTVTTDGSLVYVKAIGSSTGWKLDPAETTLDGASFGTPQDLVTALSDFSRGGTGPGSGVQSVTGDGVGGTPENPVLSYPTPEDIGAISAEQNAFNVKDVTPTLYTDKAINVKAFNNTGMSYSEGSIDFGITRASDHTMGFYAFKQGLETQASGHISSAFGLETEANEYASLAIGHYSTGGAVETEWTPGSPIFKVGNGTGARSRDNAYVLNNNGTSIQYGIAYYGADYSADFTGRSLVDKEYVDASIENSDKVSSKQEGGVGTLVTNIIQVTQAEYDGLTPQAGTFYAIVG